MKSFKKIFLIPAFLFIPILLFGINPQVAKAVTVEELQAQINALLAQIAQLQQQLAQMQGASTTWCHTFNTNLKIGDSGQDVFALNEILIRGGYVGVDHSDYFSKKTTSAVVHFQENHASEILAPLGLIRGTGFVGPATRTKLNQLCGCDNGGCNKPSIIITSPIGGEKWRVGETHDITWKSSDVSTVDIWVGPTSGAWSMVAHDIALDIPAYLGKYSWTIDSKLFSSSGPQVIEILATKTTKDVDARIDAWSKEFCISYSDIVVCK